MQLIKSNFIVTFFITCILLTQATKIYAGKMIPDSKVWGPQPIVTPKTPKNSPSTLPFRSWQLQRGGEARIKQIIDSASVYGINNIQLSHQLIRDVVEFDKGPKPKFSSIIQYAHTKNIDIHIWSQELEKIPASAKSGPLWFDHQDLWDFLSVRYNNVFKGMKGLGGIVMRFAENDLSILSNQVGKASKLSGPERIAKLVNFINDICQKYNAQLVVRTFGHSRGAVSALVEAFKLVDNNVIVMSKETSHDFILFYPHNITFGQFPGKTHIAEFDPAGEYYGVGKVPFLYPEYIHMRMNYQRQRNIGGYVLRIERQSHGANAIKGIKENLSTVDDVRYNGYNEINLYSFKRLGEDPSATPKQIWKEYIESRVGKGRHANLLIQALKLTDDCINRCVYMLGTWFGDHSKLPGRGKPYHDTRIPRIVQWNNEYKPLVEKLKKPDARTVGEVFTESKEAIFLAEAGRELIDSALAAGLSEEQYKYYSVQFDDLILFAKDWATHRNSYIKEKSGGKEPLFEDSFPKGGPPRINLSKGIQTILEQMHMEDDTPTAVIHRIAPKHYSPKQFWPSFYQKPRVDGRNYSYPLKALLSPKPKN